MSKINQKTKIEQIKENSRGLRGTVEADLLTETPTFSKDNVQVLKFHGIYQQDDRDLRKTLRSEGRDKAYSFMIRIKNPGGGRLSPQQWEVLSDAADRFGDGTLRLTTRQAVQFYGVGKQRLRDLIQYLDSQFITTFGACGDGVRNVKCCPVSSIRSGSHFDGQEWSEKIALRLAYKSTSYMDIWLDGEKIGVESEPLFSEGYLPRKFKIAIADPQDNCVDLLTNDVGILPVLENGHLKAFTILVGGGMGATHGKEETFPRLAEALTTLEPGQLLDVLESVVITQRDLGDRFNRKRARMKYVVETLGIDGFRQEIEQRLGRTLPQAEPFQIAHRDHHLGWHRQRDPRLNYLGLPIENGRILDEGSFRLKTGLREIVRAFQLDVLLTPNQDLVLSNVPLELISAVQNELVRFGIDALTRMAPLRSDSMACPALPTCGLAITEAERRLPGLLEQLEDAGYGDEAIQIRMSGCPNSCSRPPVAEIGLVGKSVDGYNVYVGGNRNGTRLAQLFEEDVQSGQLVPLIAALIEVFRKHRLSEESFGETFARLGLETFRLEYEAVWEENDLLPGLSQFAGEELPGDRSGSAG